MDASQRLGFSWRDLKARYDVDELIEDEWHTLSDSVTASILTRHLYPAIKTKSNWVLNAGAGVHGLHLPAGQELCFDLFSKPIANRKFAVCGHVEALPFVKNTFAGIVCVGEVLAYCDPSNAFSEFARVIQPNGILIIDFGSTRSTRLIGTASFGRSAVLLSSEYNGSVEKTWIYDPDYITNTLSHFGFVNRATYGVHMWSAFVKRLGLSISNAIKVERSLRQLVNTSKYSDTITIVAEATTTSMRRQIAF